MQNSDEALTGISPAGCSQLVKMLITLVPRILSLFRNEFNKFNKTGERMLDSICHMTLKIF